MRHALHTLENETGPVVNETVVTWRDGGGDEPCSSDVTAVTRFLTQVRTEN